MAQPEEMYQCQTVNCGYIYDPDRGTGRGKFPKALSLLICRMKCQGIPAWRNIGMKVLI